MKKIVFICLVCSVLFADNVKVEFPTGYKEWRHIKTMLIKPEHPMKSFHGIHHIYANKKAIEGYKTGDFKDGSILVLDLLNYKETNTTISETSRIYVATMVKDEKKYKKTHGWGYEAFKGDSNETMVTDVYKMCVKCHESQKKHDYIFSTLQD